MKEIRKKIGMVKTDGLEKSILWLTVNKEIDWANNGREYFFYRVKFNIDRTSVCSYLLRRIKICKRLFNKVDMGGYPYKEYTQIFMNFNNFDDVERFIRIIKRNPKREVFEFDLNKNSNSIMKEIKDQLKIEVI